MKKGFEMKVRQNSGAGKIVFRTVRNFNNIPHILEIRVFSFTRFFNVRFFLKYTYVEFIVMVRFQGAASVCVWAAYSDLAVGQVDLRREEATATDGQQLQRA